MKKWFNYPIKKIKITDHNYPQILRKIKNPPPLLYYRGRHSEKLFAKSLAIVGSRRMTKYGKMVLEKLLPDLVSNQVTIISGFMYGVDSYAHQITVELKGRTVAVLGYGLDVLYPEENDRLYCQILNTNGLVLSEYEPQIKGQLWTFPQRNRIIAGLASLGVLVVEASEKSGSLITARLARMQKKKLFAVPGPITSSVSAGTNLLIKKQQAKMVLSAFDILNKKILNEKQIFKTELNSTEKQILQMLAGESLTVDEIAKKIKKNVVQTGQTLTLMSLKNLAREEKGKYFIFKSVIDTYKNR